MGSRPWHLVPLLLIVSLCLWEASSHEIIWTQDPWVHQEYYRGIAETHSLEPQHPILQDFGINHFPAYHLFMAIAKAGLGVDDWNLYRLFYVLLPSLAVYLLFLITREFIDYKIGVIAATLLSTSFFFLFQLYEIGLTYNVFLMVIFLFLLYATTQDGDRWRLVLALGSVALVFTHAFSFVFLFVLMAVVKKDRPLLAFMALLVLYPLWVGTMAVKDMSTIYLNQVRNPTSLMLEYLRVRGPLFIINALFEIVFLVQGLRYSLKNKNKPLFCWIVFPALAWIAVSLPFIQTLGRLELYETDRFLFYLAFPAAISGARMVGNLNLKILSDRVLIIIIALSFLYPAYTFTNETSNGLFALERSYDGLQVLNNITGPGDVVLSSQNAWVIFVGNASGQELYVYQGGTRQLLLNAPAPLFEKATALEEPFFLGIKGLESQPRYIFLSYYEVAEYPYVVQWFRVPRDRFEVIYDDGNSLIVRINYCDKNEAIRQTYTMLESNFSGAPEVTPIDYDKTIIGEESWFVKWTQDGKEVSSFIVGKETCKIQESR